MANKDLASEGDNSKELSLWIFAYSESKLTCHFVVVVLLVLLVLGGKRSKKVGKRSKKVTSS